MKSRVDAVLRSEARRFGFRFGCEACTHFDPDTARCAHEYPNEAHLAVDLGLCESLEFCKEFELC